MAETFLQFLLLDFPKPEPPRYGFLEISNQRHRETVNSSVYGHFLSQDRNEIIANLFKDVLLNLIKEKISELKQLAFDDERVSELLPQIEDFSVQLEVQTKKSNRIDIVLTDSHNKSAVIIENKIYHYLANDLQDYWDSTDAKKKIGILLTLTKEHVPDDLQGKFVNILHKEWIEGIKQIGLPPDLDIRDYVYLNDFFYSIFELSNTNAMNDQSTFFFQHQSKILQARSIYNDAYNHVQSALNNVIERNDFESYGKNSRWIQMWPKGLNHEIYFTIVFEQILEPEDRKHPSLLIIIEIAKDILEMVADFDKLTLSNATFAHLSFKQHQIQGAWMHYASKIYYPSIEEISKLHDFVDQKLKDDFTGLFEKMLGLINENKKLGM